MPSPHGPATYLLYESSDHLDLAAVSLYALRHVAS